MSRVDARSAKVELESPKAGAQMAQAAMAAKPQAESQSKAGPSAEERLEKLDALRKKGLISAKDFEAKKKQILSEI